MKMFLPFLVFFSSLFWSHSGLSLPKKYSPIEINQAEEYRTKYINLIYGILDDESFTSEPNNLSFLYQNQNAPYLTLSHLWKGLPERKARLVLKIEIHADKIDFTNLAIQQFVDHFSGAFSRLQTHPNEKPFSFHKLPSSDKLVAFFIGHSLLAVLTAIGVGMGSGINCGHTFWDVTTRRYTTTYCSPSSPAAIVGYVGAVLFLYASVASIVSGVLFCKRVPKLDLRSMRFLIDYIAFKQTQHEKRKSSAVEMVSPLSQAAIPNWGATAIKANTPPTGLPISYQ